MGIGCCSIEVDAAFSGQSAQCWAGMLGQRSAALIRAHMARAAAGAASSANVSATATDWKARFMAPI